MTWRRIDKLSSNQIDNEIAKMIGWTKIRKKSGANAYSGINPDTNLRDAIPPFSKCPKAVSEIESRVAKQVGMSYFLYLGKIFENSDAGASWACIKQAFLEPHTRAKACLLALREHNITKSVR
jgi:hypothetical protein